MSCHSTLFKLYHEVIKTRYENNIESFMQTVVKINDGKVFASYHFSQSMFSFVKVRKVYHKSF